MRGRCGTYARDVLKTIAQAVCEVICRIDDPVAGRAVVRRVDYPICHEIPHLRVTLFEILLHPHRHLALNVLAVFHILEDLERLLDRSSAMHTRVTRTMVVAATVVVHLCRRARATVSLVSPDELHAEVVQLLEVIARVGNAEWLETEPADDLEDALEIPCFLRLRVCVIVPQIALAAMMCRIAKVDKDRFRVSDV